MQRSERLLFITTGLIGVVRLVSMSCMCVPLYGLIENEGIFALFFRYDDEAVASDLHLDHGESFKG